MALIKKSAKGVAAKPEIVNILEIAVDPKDGSITDKGGVKYILSALNPELKPSLFQNGKSYGVEILKGKGGSLYIQKLLGEQIHPVVQIPKAAESLPAKPAPYVDKRGNDIGNRGFIQAAAIAASAFSIDAVEHEKNMRKILETMDKILTERNG